VIDNPTLLERTILESIPLARAMDLSVLEYDGNRLALNAPLASNVNDKGCAFGGSMVSLMTLAGWGLVNLKLGEAECSAEVFIADSTVSYLDPLWDELVAEAAADQGQDWTEFLQDFQKRGRARIGIAIEMTSVQGGAVVCKMSARFVAKRSRN
jgi:thioesterase domain-containing protein